MNENMQLWIDTLREGKYQQGYTRLRDGRGKYCVWGVACDLYVKATGEAQWDMNFLKYLKEGTAHVALPPEAIRQWLGGVTYHEALHLASQNDSGVSFKELAEQLESDYGVQA